jgi:hypothetical protein
VVDKKYGMMKRVGVLICTFALVCSCSREDGAVSGEALEVVFSAGRGGMGRTGSGAATRATDDSWTDNDETGIYMLPAGEIRLTNAIKKNHRYVYGSGTFSAVGYPLYYPVNGDDVCFVGYYPYDPAVTGSDRKTFYFADQRTVTAKEGVDFCFHRGTDHYSRSSPNASVTFDHKFSKIRMTVKAGGSGIDLTTLASVTLKDMPASATVNLADLAALPPAATDIEVATALGIDTGTTSDIIAYIGRRTADEASVEAIVAPHTVGAGKTIEFMIGSETKIYPFDPAFTFESGKVHDFVFTLQAIDPPVTDQPTTNSSDGMTNSYMVVPGQSVTFPVSRAYTYDPNANSGQGAHTATLHVGGTYDGVNDKFFAKVIWQDPVGLIQNPDNIRVRDSGSMSIVTVTTNNVSGGGNAVVKIFKAGDTNETPVWSWHIWVTAYTGQDPGSTVDMVNGHEFMDRNLGATANDLSVAAYGLMYQWGRKDPFPGCKSGTAGWDAMSSFPGLETVVKPTAENTNDAAIIDAIQHPTTFFMYYDKVNQDWLPGQDDNLWNTSSDVKSIYDPCPAGWRVPIYVNNSLSNENSPWKEYHDLYYSSLLDDRNCIDWVGWTFIRNGRSVHYPVTGRREGMLGISIPSPLGFYWSASPDSNSNSVASFAFDNRLVQFGNLTRAHGCAVRCVRE